MGVTPLHLAATAARRGRFEAGPCSCWSAAVLPGPQLGTPASPLMASRLPTSSRLPPLRAAHRRRRRGHRRRRRRWACRCRRWCWRRRQRPQPCRPRQPLLSRPRRRSSSSSSSSSGSSGQQLAAGTTTKDQSKAPAAAARASAPADPAEMQPSTPRKNPGCLCAPGCPCALLDRCACCGSDDEEGEQEEGRGGGHLRRRQRQVLLLQRRAGPAWLRRVRGPSRLGACCGWGPCGRWRVLWRRCRTPGRPSCCSGK